MAEFSAIKYKVLVFDVYATLIDWETGLWENLRPLLERIDSPLANTKNDALSAFFSVETDLQARYPTMLYRDLLARAHAELASRLKGQPSIPETSTTTPVTTVTSGYSDIQTTKVETSASARSPQVDPDEHEHIAFGQAIPKWPVFPDTIAALHYLSTQFKLTVLSNVDQSSFSGTRKVLETSDPDHQFKFDAIYTAEDIGSYKPNVANFEHALRKIKEEFGVDRDEVLVVAASLSHDHVPANTLGLSSVFIDRRAASLNHGVSARYDAKFGSLGEFAEQVRKQAERS